METGKQADGDVPSPPPHLFTSLAVHTIRWCNSSPLAYRWAEPMMGRPRLDGGCWQLPKPGCYIMWHRIQGWRDDNNMTELEKEGRQCRLFWSTECSCQVGCGESGGGAGGVSGGFWDLTKLNLPWKRWGLYDAQGVFVIKCKKSRGLTIPARVTGWILALCQRVMGQRTWEDKCHLPPSFVGEFSRSMRPDLFTCRVRCVWGKSNWHDSGGGEKKSIGNVGEPGGVKGSQRTSGLIGMQRKAR